MVVCLLCIFHIPLVLVFLLVPLLVVVPDQTLSASDHDSRSFCFPYSRSILVFCSLSRTSTPSLCVVVPSRDVSVVVASKFKIAFHLGVWSTACCGGSLKYRTFWFYLVFNWSILGVCST